MKTSEILNRAAEVMIERGHTKGEYEDQDGRICLVGSVQCAIGGDAEDTYVTGRLLPLTYLRKVIGYSIPSWNDRSETTETMALGALHEAAILAKEQGD